MKVCPEAAASNLGIKKKAGRSCDRAGPWILKLPRRLYALFVRHCRQPARPARPEPKSRRVVGSGIVGVDGPGATTVPIDPIAVLFVAGSNGVFFVAPLV